MILQNYLIFQRLLLVLIACHIFSWIVVLVRLVTICRVTESESDSAGQGFITLASPPARRLPRGAMFKCCRCSQLFATQQGVKNHTTRMVRAVPAAEPARPSGWTRARDHNGRLARAAAAAAASAEAASLNESQSISFHKGNHGLSGAGPGYIHVILSNAQAAAGAAGGPGLTQAAPAPGTGHQVSCRDSPDR